MNVYLIHHTPPSPLTGGVSYIAALDMASAIKTLGAVSVTGAQELGPLIFAAESKALAGGRKLTLDEAKASITDSHLVSFEDGRPYKSLTRHLKAHGLTFDQYKAKWGLPEQYPSVHPSYTIMRRDMALAAGLGKGKKGKAK